MLSRQNSETPMLGADSRGVWQESAPGVRSELLWSEIELVRAHQIDLIEKKLTVLAFEHESGHSLEFFADSVGFEEFFERVMERLGLNRGLLESVPEDGSEVVFWEKA